LARALLTAGAKRCVVALWPVDDVPACVIMHEFHRHLAEGIHSPSLALSKAQETVLGMSEGQLVGRYRSLGGDASGGERSTRRGESFTTCSRAARLLEMDPEFEEEPPGQAEVALDGWVPRVWAPFVMVGC